MISVYLSSGYSEEENKPMDLLKVEYRNCNIKTLKRRLRSDNPTAKILLINEDGDLTQVCEIYDILKSRGYKQIYTDVCDGWYEFSRPLLDLLKELPGFVEG